MAGSVHRLLLLLLAACLLRLQISDCSPSVSSSQAPAAEEPRKPGGPHGDALRHQLQLDAKKNRTALPTTTMATAPDDGRTSAAVHDDGAASSAATPPPALDKKDGVGSGPRQTSGPAGFRPAVLLCSKRWARRFLDAASVDDAGTDGAGLSCHSNSVHINCPPGSKP